MDESTLGYDELRAWERITSELRADPGPRTGTRTTRRPGARLRSVALAAVVGPLLVSGALIAATGLAHPAVLGPIAVLAVGGGLFLIGWAMRD